MRKPRLNTIRYIGVANGTIALILLLASPFGPPITIYLAGFFTLLMSGAAIAQMHFYPESLP